MSVDRTNAEFAHGPWLGAEGTDDRETSRRELAMKRVNGVDFDIGVIRAIAETMWRESVGTFAGHDETPIAHRETPTGIADLDDAETKHAAIVIGVPGIIQHSRSALRRFMISLNRRRSIHFDPQRAPAHQR